MNKESFAVQSLIAANLLREEKYNLRNLTKHGYIRFEPRDYLVYINYKKGLVIKRPYLTLNTTPRYAIPTTLIKKPLSKAEKEAIELDLDASNMDHLLIQPLAYTDNFSRDIAYKDIKGASERWADIQYDNVGICDGKSVLIDW